MKFCKYCGKELNDKEQCTCSEAMLSSKKKLITIIGGTIVALVLIIVICLISFNPSNKINVFDYMKTPSIDGSSSEGTFHISLDTNKLIYALIGSDGSPSNGGDQESAEWLKKYIAYESIVKDIDIEISKKEGLSNGDVVTVTVRIPDSLSSELKGGSKEYTVSGLPDLTVVDFFKDIEIVFDGVSGNATAKIVKLTEDKALKACTFEISTNYKLSNGSEITVSITNAEALKNNHLVVPKDLSKTYV